MASEAVGSGSIPLGTTTCHSIGDLQDQFHIGSDHNILFQKHKGRAISTKSLPA